MSLKEVNGDKITDQKELCLVVDDYNKAVNLLKIIGCEEKSYQETKREFWIFDDVEVTIDEWPYLEPFVEVEGNSELSVKKACQKLELNYTKAVFGSVDKLYNLKYGTSINVINNETPRITFQEENPFTKQN